MRSAEYTQEKIIQAGKELAVEGRSITGFALRQRLGGGTLSRLKQVWDDHISAEKNAEPAADLPQDVAETMSAVIRGLSERLMSLASEINDRAIKAAERKVHEVVRTAGEQRYQAERELEDAVLAVDELETRLEMTELHLSWYKDQVIEMAQLRERVFSLEQASRKFEAEAEAATEAAAKAHEEAHRLHGQLDAVKEQNRELLKTLEAINKPKGR